MEALRALRKMYGLVYNLMLLAALLYIYRVTQTTTIARVTPEYIEEGRPHSLQDKEIPDYVSILRIHGPFL